MAEQPSTRRHGPRRRGPARTAEQKLFMQHNEKVRRAAAGDTSVALPPVVHRSMQLLPPAERPDFRQRGIVPFERSYFQAQRAALDRKVSEMTWWEWLQAEGRPRGLFDGFVNNFLTDAPQPLLNNCRDVLDTWLLQGESDAFATLRRELLELEKTPDGREVALAVLQKKDADAYEYKFSKGWLLGTLLGLLVKALRASGIIKAAQRQQCVGCCNVYDEKAPGNVALTCFLPCCHWLCHACYARDLVAKKETSGRLASCPECNVERLPMIREWPGAMVVEEQCALRIAGQM